MKIIVPMAGGGSRLRPHTLLTPKPLVPVAGKPIVQRLVEDIVGIYEGDIEEIAFIIGSFGKDVEDQLKTIAANLGTKGTIYYQEEALGTAHAIYQARKSMEGEVIVAFADTLFQADFKLDREKDGVIWVKKVEDPSAYGVVTLDENGIIQEFVEKPQEFVSDFAIIGIYYFRDGEKLLEEIQYLLDNNVVVKGEYQLTDVLENMKAKGARFVPGEVREWMDCGNKGAVLDTTEKVLAFDYLSGKQLIAESVITKNAVIIPPCFIGENVKLTNSIVGPYVFIGDNSQISNSIVKMSSIREETVIENAVLDRAMIGSYAACKLKASALDIGDYSKILS